MKNEMSKMMGSALTIKGRSEQNPGLVDMKRSAKEMKNDTETAGVAGPSAEEYPYGLRLDLDTEELDKLEISLSGLSVGDKVVIAGEGEIYRLEQRSTQEKDSSEMCVQIKKLKLEM